MLTVLLSAHNLLIAAIFVPYLILMTGLGVWIYRSGRPRDREADSSDDDREDRLPAAA